MYEKYFAGQYTREEFYALNERVCRDLQNKQQHTASGGGHFREDSKVAMSRISVSCHAVCRTHAAQGEHLRESEALLH